MKLETLIALIKELFNLTELHREYTDNNIHYVIDSTKEGDTLTIKVKYKENKDKKEFEDFINVMPEDLFQEVWESLSLQDNLHSLDELYNSENYKEVIDKFKLKSKQVAREKMNKLSKFL